jgi:hydrogenase maturation factor
MKQKEFETACLYTASIICILLGINPSYKVEKGKTLFVFPASDDLYKAMNAYNNGIQVNAYEYASMIKRQRAEMLMRRGMEGRK